MPKATHALLCDNFALLISKLLYSGHTCKTKLRDNSGGSFDNFIHKKFSGRIPFYTILAIHILVSKIIRLATTTVLKLNFA